MIRNHHDWEGGIQLDSTSVLNVVGMSKSKSHPNATRILINWEGRFPLRIMIYVVNAGAVF